jgi:N-methylhydantoinase B/oxoprolinase/acetone carboxylase alpha subunit
MDKPLNLPKTTDRVMFEHFHNQAYDIIEQIEKLKKELPAEILKKAVEDFECTISNSRKEIIDITNQHKEHLIKVHNDTFSSLKTSISDHTNSLDYSINNNLLYLGLFGFFCSIVGGLAVWFLQIFIR